MIKFIPIIILTMLVSCDTKQGTEKIIDKSVKTEILKSDNTHIDSLKDNTTNTEILETFIDSTNIGEKGKCKIELIKHRVFDDNYVIIKFYRRGHKDWYIQNTYYYETNALMDFDPNIADFNNDRFNDITFISGEAARGSNELRRLLIYDNKKYELISIVNSQDYPNMLYNNELDCIDAFLIYGGCSTVFARIKGDSLIEFASVNNCSERTIYEIDKFGKEKLLSKDSIINSEDIFLRYKNYKPLKEY